MELTAKTFSELTPRELYEILKSRAEIFIIEQNINYNDMDDVDYESLHCFFTENGAVTAYLRAYRIDEDTVKAGRVLTRRHGHGLGRELLEKSIPAIAKRIACKKIHIDAQKHAVGFYEKFGFVVTSGEFLEEGIVHVSMELDLSEAST